MPNWREWYNAVLAGYIMLSRAMLEEGEERQDLAFEAVVVVVDASLMGGEEDGGRGGGDQSTAVWRGP